MIQWESGTGYCSFIPPYWNPEQYISCSLYGLREGRGWCEGHIAMSTFLFCVAQSSVISVRYTHKEGTLKGEAGAIAFFFFNTASIWQENSRVQCCENHVLTFSSSRTRDCKLAFPRLPSPHQYFGIHYSGIFSKATSGNSCDFTLWHT